MAARKELAVGVVDGLNAVFSTSLSYVAGTVVAFRNGQELAADTVELTGNDFSFGITPITGDVVSVYYRTS